MPKYMATYDMMETARNTNGWLGATARAVASYPAFGLVTNPAFQLMAAWGEVTERSFARMVAKPDWGIHTVTGEDGRDHIVTQRAVVERPFGDLLEFEVSGRDPMPRRVLLVAPMSGHYATLLRSTVRSLLPDCDVYVTDWRNARDIPVSEGKFDVEDYTLYLADFIRALGPDIHVVAVCQPVPLALAATAWLAQEAPEAQPASLILIGGPVDPDANATDVTDFGRRVTMGQLERHIVQRVGFKYAGAGRMVYPGLLQLASFMSMNAERHTKAFAEQVLALAKGEASDHDKHNRFYDEYLAVMDMTAEFYLSTVERIFKDREIARNAFTVEGRAVDLGRITDVAVKVVEGEKDDISAPGQCLAALDLLTGVPADRKASHLEPGAGHYGIFAGGSWRRNIRPLVLDFIDANARGGAEPVAPPPEREPAPAPATLGEAERIAEGETDAGSIPPRRRAPRRAPAAKAPAPRTSARRARAEATPRPATSPGRRSSARTGEAPASAGAVEPDDRGAGTAEAPKRAATAKPKSAESAEATRANGADRTGEGPHGAGIPAAPVGGEGGTDIAPKAPETPPAKTVKASRVKKPAAAEDPAPSGASGKSDAKAPAAGGGKSSPASPPTAAELVEPSGVAATADPLMASTAIPAEAPKTAEVAGGGKASAPEGPAPEAKGREKAAEGEAARPDGGKDRAKDGPTPV